MQLSPSSFCWYIFAEILLAVIWLENHLLGTAGQRSYNRSTNYKNIEKVIHSGAINSFIDSRPVNCFLGVETPFIAERKHELTHERRVDLAQLRSGYSSRLNSYISRIDPDILNITLLARPNSLTPFPLLRPRRNSHFSNLPLSDFDVTWWKKYGAWAITKVKKAY